MLNRLKTRLRAAFSRAMESVTSFFHPARRQREYEEEQKRLLHEQEEIIALARRFDSLDLAGFNKIQEVAWLKINASIAEATEYPLEPVKQAVCVSRWDAQRSLMDALLAYINDTKSERDKIEEQRRRALEEANKPQMHTWDYMGQESGMTGI